MRNNFPKQLSGDVPVGFATPPPYLWKCIVLIAVAKGWLLHSMGWFVLFLVSSGERDHRIFIIPDFFNWSKSKSWMYSIICLFRIAVGPDEKFELDRVRITESFTFRLRE